MDYSKCESCDKPINSSQANMMGSLKANEFGVKIMEIWCSECCLKYSKVKGFERMFFSAGEIEWSEELWQEVLEYEESSDTNVVDMPNNSPVFKIDERHIKR